MGSLYLSLCCIHELTQNKKLVVDLVFRSACPVPNFAAVVAGV